MIEECKNNLIPSINAEENISILPENYSCEVPLRFAQILESNDIATIEYPTSYRRQFREILRADG